VIRVIDGENIIVKYEGKKYVARLHRMDSSNKGERGYYEAKEALSDMIEGKEVSLEFETPGRM